MGFNLVKSRKFLYRDARTDHINHLYMTYIILLTLHWFGDSSSLSKILSYPSSLHFSSYKFNITDFNWTRTNILTRFTVTHPSNNCDDQSFLHQKRIRNRTWPFQIWNIRTTSSLNWSWTVWLLKCMLF